MTKIVENDDQSLEFAADLLKRKEIVAFPTDTVFGLGAHLFFDEAIQKIFKAKKRALNKPINVLISDIHQVETLAQEIPDEFYQLAEAFFPGALTIILKKQPHISSLLTAHEETVGVRMPNSSIALKLIEKTNAPLATTSVNISGEKSLSSPSQILDVFEGEISAIVKGECCFNKESTIISLKDCVNPIILREGQIKKEEIEQILKKIIKINNR